MSAAIVSAACGTTVPVVAGTSGAGQQQPAAGDPADQASAQGLGSPATPGVTDGLSPKTDPAVPPAQESASDRGISDSVAAATRPGAAPGSGRPAAAGTSAPGVTSDTILVGVTDAQSADEAFAAAGVKGSSQGSNTRKATALVDYLNKNGGVAGRKLKLVVHKFETANSENRYQEACATFTQDQRVFAVLSYGQASSDVFRQCLSKSGVLLLGDNGTHFDTQILRQHPTLWPVGGFNIERKIPAYIDGLVAQGFFSPWDTSRAAAGKTGTAKVGLLFFDVDFNKRHNADLDAAMAPHKRKIDTRFAIRNSGKPALQDSDSQADIKAAVLRFASDGVTHVIFNQEVAGDMFGLFALNAGSQNYYPRYGVSSVDFPYLIKENLPDHKVLNGLKGIGWLPTLDVDRPAALSAMQKSCLKIYSDAGQAPADRNEQAIMLINCDVFFNFTRAAGLAGRQLTPSTFFRGISRLGTQASHAWSGLDYSQHIDGVSQVSYLEYAGAPCDCIRYTKTAQRVG
jgi:hypothetical protein